MKKTPCRDSLLPASGATSDEPARSSETALELRGSVGYLRVRAVEGVLAAHLRLARRGSAVSRRENDAYGGIPGGLLFYHYNNYLFIRLLQVL